MARDRTSVLALERVGASARRVDQVLGGGSGGVRIAVEMLAKGDGAIVNTTTVAAHIGVPGAPVYSATKAAVAGLTRSWAAEWSSLGVRVNSIAPGPTLNDGVVVEWGEEAKKLGETMPIGRNAKPEELAEAILFLASPRASYVTGTTLAVDGGGSFH